MDLLCERALLLYRRRAGAGGGRRTGAMAEDRGGILHLGRGDETVDTDRVRVRQELSMFPCTQALLSWWKK